MASVIQKVGMEADECLSTFVYYCEQNNGLGMRLASLGMRRQSILQLMRDYAFTKIIEGGDWPLP